MQCALCETPIGADPDAMALICKNGHQDVVHDKCYKNRYSNEVYKKAQHGESTKYGRGPAKERCLHDGCSSFVKIKALGKGDEVPKEPKQNGGGRKAPPRRPRREEEEGEYEEEEPKCQAFKADGSRCGRALADKELLACRLHVDALRKQKEFAEKAAEEAQEREQQAELELQAARERTDDMLPELDKEALLPNREGRSGIAIEIGDAPANRGPDEAERAATRERAAARAAKERAAAAPAKPAKWAAAEEGQNAKKAWNAAVDKTGLEDCPICLEEPADVQMNPCKHTCCGGCLDQWMSQKSSFASTLRSGSSDTTCPMCRQAVDETAAARPTAESAASALAARVEEDDADLDVDWIALAQQRQAEVMAQARALREDLTPLPTLPPPPARRAPQAPIGTPQAPIGTPNPNWQRDSFQRESSC